MKVKHINILLPLLTFIFTLGWIVGFSTVAVAEMEDEEHAQHIPSEAGRQQRDSNPLGPLQEALNKNNRHFQQKVQDSKPQAPRKTQNPMNPSMNASPAPTGGMGGAGMMGMMNQMPANPQASVPASSELPGFPGASHIYHIGATGFFVDHADMVNFKTSQLASLKRLKEQSLLVQSSFERKIQRAEEELWELTASDRPDIKKIEAKVRESESLKVEKRISFIRYVGVGVNILTDEQRSILLGTSPPKSPGPAADTVKTPASSMPLDKSSPIDTNSMDNI